MTIEEIAAKGSSASQEAFNYLRELLMGEAGVVEAVDYERL